MRPLESAEKTGESGSRKAIDAAIPEIADAKTDLALRNTPHDEGIGGQLGNPHTACMFFQLRSMADWKNPKDNFIGLQTSCDQRIK